MCYAARLVFPAVALPVLVTMVAGPAAAQAPAESDSSMRAEAYARFMIGRHLEGLENVDGAVQAFRDAARLDPAAGEPFAELAALYARAGEALDAADAATPSDDAEGRRKLAAAERRYRRVREAAGDDGLLP